MKTLKYCFYLLLFFGSFSCSNSNDPLIQCAAIDYAIPGLLIEITDIEGNNLLDNNTYDPQEVQVIVDDILVSRIVTQEDGTLINVLLSDALNNKDAEVVLSATETDIVRVQLTTTTTGSPCFFPIFNVDEVLYNNNNVPIEDLAFNQKIIIVK